MKHNALEMSLLLDYYGELLTEKQRTCFDLYYNQDLSLGEIAQEAGISRQAVHDILARAEGAMESMEEKIGCVARARRQQQALEQISAAAAALLEQPQAKPLAEAILAAAATIKE
ncbi:MAG TPA: YlxM family DNA-binding protein [Candidatus Avoscillospira avicola]|uniref:UPF0122 protein IAA53_02770 n=1 Tax=Candidatus Avoscillospira avicola TaxID=2840706 RepID=A0A9D1DGI0_9FIRM|nr:YlxM family DNA-binding protein [Candidatus Avoscillospira avicola]